MQIDIIKRNLRTKEDTAIFTNVANIYINEFNHLCFNFISNGKVMVYETTSVNKIVDTNGFRYICTRNSIYALPKIKISVIK